MLARELHIAEEFPRVSLDRWRGLVEADLAGAGGGEAKGLFERKLVTHTYEGVYIQPLYTELEWDSSAGQTGCSGSSPWVRGSVPLGTAVDGWDIRQEHGWADPAEFNARMLEDLNGGVTSVLLRMDAAGRAGLDADDPEAAKLVGVDGCTLSSGAEWDRAFAGVHVGMIGVTLEAGAAFVAGAAQLMALWERAGLEAVRARGAFNADPLAALARDGTVPIAIDGLLHQMGDLAAFTSARYPLVTSVRVGTAAYHHAGATATQDLAFAMASGVEYLRFLTGAGLSVDAASRQMLFSMAVGCHFFLAIAKLRAARRMWGRVVEKCGGTLGAAGMRLHVRTSKRVLTHRDPWVNILRNAACVFAAGVGGAEAIGSEPFDGVLGPASELGRRVARNTQHMLMEEAHLHRVCDPAGGSHYLESLTEELADAAWVIFRDIERRGGMLACLKSGWVQEQIDASYRTRAKNIATVKDQVLGVSAFANLLERLPTPKIVDLDRVRVEAVRRLGDHRSASSRDRVGQRDFGDGASLTAAAVDAARRGATIGEISRRVFGTGVPLALSAGPLAVHPYAEPFERLRDAADGLAEECGRRPIAALLTLGSAAEHGARAGYARNFFQAGGFEVRSAMSVSQAAGAGIVVICGSDAQYAEGQAERAAAELRAAGVRTVVLAGQPGSREGAYRAAGIDRFIFVKCDVVRTLTELLSEEGATI